MKILKEEIWEFEDQHVRISDYEYRNIETEIAITKEEYEKIRTKIAWNVESYNLQEAGKLGINGGFYLGKVKPPKKKKTNTSAFGNGEFNMFYRISREKLHEQISDPYAVLVLYELAMLLSFPYNCVLLKGAIPSYDSLAEQFRISVRKLKGCLRLLEEKNVILIKQATHKKCIYINPEYVASGTNLDNDTLKMFGLYSENI